MNRDVKEADIYISPDDYSAWKEMDLEQLEALKDKAWDMICDFNEYDNEHTKRAVKRRYEALKYFIQRRYGEDPDDTGVIL